MAASRASRIGAWTVFVFAWAAVLVVALALVAVGVSMADGAVAFSHCLTRIAPYALLWRIGIYVVIGTLYITRWRPRLRALQNRQTDGGEAAHQRLVRVERMFLVVIVAVEVANAPDLIDWMMAG
ncbi:hypothetical protein [Salinisphaera aquimarina]|uniref:Copper resistance protein D domain-containing protein n=1 Tax=Salinisphaera aquimarina TaxID=2094031 RepID=A0ABV7EUA8_9GAMM